MTWFVLKRPRLPCGGWTVGGRSEAGRLMLGESELSTFTCPESKEAMLLKDLGFQQLIRKRGERGQRTAEAARHSGCRACGHRLPLEPVRSVLALLLELRLPERAQDSPRVTSSYHQAPRPREMGREGTELKPASPTSSQLSSEGRGMPSSSVPGLLLPPPGFRESGCPRLNRGRGSHEKATLHLSMPLSVKWVGT